MHPAIETQAFEKKEIGKIMSNPDIEIEIEIETICPCSKVRAAVCELYCQELEARCKACQAVSWRKYCWDTVGKQTYIWT